MQAYSELPSQRLSLIVRVILTSNRKGMVVISGSQAIEYGEFTRIVNLPGYNGFFFPLSPFLQPVVYRGLLLISLYALSCLNLDLFRHFLKMSFLEDVLGSVIISVFYGSSMEKILGSWPYRPRLQLFWFFCCTVSLMMYYLDYRKSDS